MFKFWDLEGSPAVSTTVFDSVRLSSKGVWSPVNGAGLERDGILLSESAWRRRFAAELHSAPDFAKALESNSKKKEPPAGSVSGCWPC